MWGAGFSLLEAFFSDVSVLLTVIALDSLLIFPFPPLFQESGPWGKRGLLPFRSFSIGVSFFMHSDVLPLGQLQSVKLESSLLRCPWCLDREGVGTVV